MPKNKKNEQAETPLYSDFGTPQRARQMGGLKIEVADRDRKGNVVQTRARAKITDKVDWYFHTGTIDSGMRDAGKKMMFILFCAGKVPVCTVMYRELIQRSRMPGDYEKALNSKTWAQEKLEDALALLSSGEQDVLWDICALDQYAGQNARLRWMISGLAKLAGHWGFIAEGDGA